VTGAFDYHLQVACRDTAELDAMLRTLKRKLGAAHTETRVVLRTAVAAGG
jgi:Lrp/AsnC family transcriptional regulator, leucine-responsive regulatory protein